MEKIEDLTKKIFPLLPDNLTENVWGGDWIPKLKGIQATGPVGESWEFSGHPSHPSRVKLPDQSVKTLPEILRQAPTSFLGQRVVEYAGSLAPILVKLIDAADNLSVQVHPPDEYAQLHEGESGKHESWLILEASQKEDEGYIYLGFDQRMSSQYSSPDQLKEAFLKAIKTTTPTGSQAKLVLPFLNKVRVKPGDTFDLPPGTIHAIGRGVRLIEIQQSSGITYRVWDWNRPQKRPLQVEKAMDVIEFTGKDPQEFSPAVKKGEAAVKGKVHEHILFQNRPAHYAVSQITFLEKGGGHQILAPTGVLCANGD